MSLQQAIGKFCAGNRSLESAVVWLGHQLPGSRVVRSLCNHTGNQISIREPTAVRAAFTRLGTYLSVRLDDPVSRHIYFHGEYEPKISGIVQRLGQAGQVWLDVGGHAGFFAMLASKGAGDRGHVYVFEPRAAMAERIRASIVLNGATNVHLETEDDFLDRVDVKPDFMMIGIEGFEMNAFRGMERLLRNNPPKLIIAKLNQIFAVQETPGEMISYLAGFDYLAWRIGDDALQPYVPGAAMEPADQDFVFIQKNLADEFLRVLKK